MAQVSIPCAMRYAPMQCPAVLCIHGRSLIGIRCRRQSNGTMEEAREALADPQAEVHLQVRAAQVPSSLLLLVVNRLAQCGGYTHDYLGVAREEKGLKSPAGG